MAVPRKMRQVDGDHVPRTERMAPSKSRRNPSTDQKKARNMQRRKFSSADGDVSRTNEYTSAKEQAMTNPHHNWMMAEATADQRQTEEMMRAEAAIFYRRLPKIAKAHPGEVELQATARASLLSTQFHPFQREAKVAFLDAVAHHAKVEGVKVAFTVEAETPDATENEVGYLCKKCGGPAPMGVGFVDDSAGAAEKSLGLTECACGYSQSASGLTASKTAATELAAGDRVKTVKQVTDTDLGITVPEGEEFTIEQVHTHGGGGQWVYLHGTDAVFIPEELVKVSDSVTGSRKVASDGDFTPTHMYEANPVRVVGGGGEGGQSVVIVHEDGLRESVPKEYLEPLSTSASSRTAKWDGWESESDGSFSKDLRGGGSAKVFPQGDGFGWITFGAGNMPKGDGTASSLEEAKKAAERGRTASRKHADVPNYVKDLDGEEAYSLGRGDGKDAERISEPYAEGFADAVEGKPDRSNYWYNHGASLRTAAAEWSLYVDGPAITIYEARVGNLSVELHQNKSTRGDWGYTVVRSNGIFGDTGSTGTTDLEEAKQIAEEKARTDIGFRGASRTAAASGTCIGCGQKVEPGEGVDVPSGVAHDDPACYAMWVDKTSSRRSASWAASQGWEDGQKANANGVSVGNPYTDGTASATEWKKGKDAFIAGEPQPVSDDDGLNSGTEWSDDMDPALIMSAGKRRTYTAQRKTKRTYLRHTASGMDDLVEAVKAHALAHYEDGGWSVVVEAYEDKEIADVISRANATSVSAAIAAFGTIVDVWEDRFLDGLNSAF